jgi:hypothetical protein
MSVARKNARRLRDLRRCGVSIDANYRITGETVRRLNLPTDEALPAAFRPQLVDLRRLLYRLDPKLQRAVLKGLRS